MISAIIVDSNPAEISQIKKTIKQFFGMVTIFEECSNIITATQAIVKINPDLVIMEPDLPDGNAFEIFNCLAKVDFKLIVTSHHPEINAIKAINYHALDFWEKPIHEATIIKGMIEACIIIETNKLRLIEQRKSEFNTASSPLILHTSNDVHIVKQEEVLYCASEGSYTQFILKSGKKLLVSKNLKSIEGSLVNAPFFRIHHAFLVNMQHIAKYTRAHGGAVYFNDGTYLPVSVRKKPELLRLLEGMQQ